MATAATPFAGAVTRSASLSNTVIGTELFISENTVMTHVARVAC